MQYLQIRLYAVERNFYLFFSGIAYDVAIQITYFAASGDAEAITSAGATDVFLLRYRRAQAADIARRCWRAHRMLASIGRDLCW